VIGSTVDPRSALVVQDRSKRVRPPSVARAAPVTWRGVITPAIDRPHQVPALYPIWVTTRDGQACMLPRLSLGPATDWRVAGICHPDRAMLSSHPTLQRVPAQENR
jgi:hypothetical protein